MQAYPSWVGDDGFPLSWRHYMYGMNHLRRASIEHKLDLATAARVAQATKDDYRNWRNDMMEMLYG